MGAFVDRMKTHPRMLRMMRFSYRLYIGSRNAFLRAVYLPVVTRRTIVDPSAQISPSAVIARKGVRIGKNCIIRPGAVILARTEIGDGSSVGSNTVVGSEGFDCFNYGTGVIAKKHAGAVRIGSGVQIGACSCIDKGNSRRSMTAIGDHSSIGDAVHIAHNVITGERCAISSGAMVAGHAVLGNEVDVGMNASISNRISIAAGSSVMGGAVVTRNLDAKGMIEGNFAVDSGKFRSFIKSIVNGAG
jgi:UDP-3-O-[3-hydroxymyristoyl] glucosamine N-acyltransferase